MKKILVCLMIACFLGGCCTIQNTDGTSTKTFLNCFKKGQGVVCGADPATVAAIQVFINFATPLIAAAAPGSQLLLAFATAQNIQKYGCAALTDLNALIAFIQGINTAQVQVAKVAGKKMAAPLIPVDPIIAWSKK